MGLGTANEAASRESDWPWQQRPSAAGGPQDAAHEGWRCTAVLLLDPVSFCVESTYRLENLDCVLLAGVVGDEISASEASEPRANNGDALTLAWERHEGGRWRRWLQLAGLVVVASASEAMQCSARHQPSPDAPLLLVVSRNNAAHTQMPPLPRHPTRPPKHGVS